MVTKKIQPTMGWDAKNHTFNGVFAVKRGNKIFANTGDYMYAEKITPANKSYVQKGSLSKEAFDRVVAGVKKSGQEYIIHEENDYPIEIKRLMIRVPYSG
jgi:hypothetical protein